MIDEIKIVGIWILISFVLFICGSLIVISANSEILQYNGNILALVLASMYGGGLCTLPFLDQKDDSKKQG